MTDHPPIETLRRFADGLLKPDDMATVAIHVAGCQACRRRANREEQTESPYAGAIRRVAGRATRREARLEQEKRRASSDLARILALPTEEWNRAIRSSPRYHSYAFALRALAASKAGWTDDPHRSERLAELGLFVADRLTNAEHGRRNLNDLRSRAWAYIGNCRRIQGDLIMVPDALEAAVELHHRGLGGATPRIGVIGFTRSFLATSRRFQQALALVTEIDELTNHIKNRGERARNLWARGTVELDLGQPARAVETFRTAECELDATIAAADPRSFWMIKYGLAVAVCDAIGPRPALAVFRQLGPFLPSLTGKRDRAHVEWFLGRVLWRAGRLTPALTRLAACRRAMEKCGAPVVGSEIGLEVCQILLELDRQNQALVVASELIPTFALRGLDQLTLQAIDLFRRAGGLS